MPALLSTMSEYRRIHGEVTTHESGEGNIDVMEAAKHDHVALAVLVYTTPGGEYVRQLVTSGPDARMIELIAWLVSIGPELIADYTQRLKKIEDESPLAPIPGAFNNGGIQ